MVVNFGYNSAAYHFELFLKFELFESDYVEVLFVF